MIRAINAAGAADGDANGLPVLGELRAHPSAVVGSSYVKGTGTSEAAALVSGVAALMFQANPALTPDLAKGILSRRRSSTTT